MNLNDEIEKHEKSLDALVKTVFEFVTGEADTSISEKILKLKAVKIVLDPDSELEGHVSPFDALIDMAKSTKEAIKSMATRCNVEDDEYEDYDLPRHYYGEDGEVLFYDD